MKLEVLTRGQCQAVRDWRNKELQFLRTPYRITEIMQDAFFDNVINDRDSKHRYFAIMNDEKITPYVNEPYIETTFIGMTGLTNIEWENGTAEISLIINPDYRGKGYGKKSVDLLLHEAFDSMRLYSIYGEVYECGNKGFWDKIVEYNNGYKTKLQDRKFYNGIMYDSMWFSIKG